MNKNFIHHIGIFIEDANNTEMCVQEFIQFCTDTDSKISLTVIREEVEFLIGIEDSQFFHVNSYVVLKEV